MELSPSLLPLYPSIEASIGMECLFFLYSLLFGFIGGFSYDILRILRRLVPHSTVPIAIEDVLFCILFTSFYICLVYCANYGETRFFSVFAAGTGFFIYMKTLGALTKALTVQIKKALGRLNAFISGKLAKRPKKIKEENKSERQN